MGKYDIPLASYRESPPKYENENLCNEIIEILKPYSNFELEPDSGSGPKIQSLTPHIKEVVRDLKIFFNPDIPLDMIDTSRIDDTFGARKKLSNIFKEIDSAYKGKTSLKEPVVDDETMRKLANIFNKIHESIHTKLPATLCIPMEIQRWWLDTKRWEEEIRPRNKEIDEIITTFEKIANDRGFGENIGRSNADQFKIDFLHNHYFSVFQLIIIQADN